MEVGKTEQNKGEIGKPKECVMPEGVNEAEMPQQGVVRPKGTVTLADGSAVRIIRVGRKPTGWYVSRIVKGMLRGGTDGFIILVPWGAAYATQQSLHLATTRSEYKLEQLTMNEFFMVFLLQKLGLNLKEECERVLGDVMRSRSRRGVM